LRVASGEALPLKQDELSINGWAIEARLYAEDPTRDFLPSVGTLEHFDLGENGRIETGVHEGDTISPYYDPMIAKVVAHGDDRDEAIAGLADMLDAVEVWPVRTNAGFLRSLLAMDEFKEARLDTGLIGREGDALTAKPIPDSVLLAAMSWRLEEFIGAQWEGNHSISPNGLFGFRMSGARAPAKFALRLDGDIFHVSALPAGQGDHWQWNIDVDGRAELESTGSLPTTHGPMAEVQPNGPIRIFQGGFGYEIDFGPEHGSVGAAAGDGAILAPMPGKVSSIEVAAGEPVTKGQRLLTLEAMKMEHGLVAPFDGVVAELNAVAGAQVQVDAVLVRIEKSDS
jgi:3-methylcrotonyl-CoA carboxylase alpha subunit